MSARHPAVEFQLQFFKYDHLPSDLWPTSAPFAALALQIADGPQNAEATVALRKLLEAKDCAVRAVVADRNAKVAAAAAAATAALGAK